MVVEMINCKIAIKKYIPEAGMTFTEFACDNYTELSSKFSKIINLLKKQNSQQLFCIKVHLTDNNEPCDPLINLMNRKSNVLFYIGIPGNPDLQTTLQTIYDKSLKTWFASQAQLPKNKIKLTELASTEEYQELLYLPKQENPQVPRHNLAQWQPTILVNKSSDLAVEQDATANTFMEICGTPPHPFDFWPFLFSKMGKEWMIFLSQELGKLSEEQRTNLNTVMFSHNKTNIIELAHPNCIFYLDIINSWPPNLFANWLYWYSLDDSDLSFIESIRCLQEFWVLCQDYNPEIPKISNQRPMSFVTRTQQMSWLISSVDAKWKRTQLQFIFNLDWSQFAEIKQLKDNGSNWIRQEMLETSAIGRAQRYLAQHFENSNDSSLVNICESISTHDKPEFIAWLYCLKPALTKQHQETLIAWYETQGMKQTLLVKLRKLTNNHHLSSTTLVAMLGSDNFNNLLALYQLWMSKNQYGAHNHWVTWLEFHNRNGASIAFNVDALVNLSFQQLYFYCVVAHEATGYDEILSAFANLPSDLQRKLVYIFLSRTSFEVDKDLLAELLKDADLGTSVADTVCRYFAEPMKFMYFQKATKWDVVADSLKKMSGGIIEVINCFSDDSIKFSSYPGINFSFKSCLKDELVAELEAIRENIKKIESLNLNTDFLRLSGLLAELENKITSLLARPLKGNLSDSIMGWNGLLISQLDGSLKEHDKTFADLVHVMHAKFATLQKIGIEKYFNKDALAILGQTKEHESILANIINKFLISSVTAQLDDGNYPGLIHFIGKIALNETSIEDFFARFKVIEQVKSTWGTINDAATWQVCVSHQLLNGQPYANTHWKICCDLIATLKDNPHMLLCLDKILQAKTILPKNLTFNGEIDHAHWQFLLAEVKRICNTENIHAPVFDLLLTPALEHYLKFGTSYDFKQFANICQKVQIDARPKILDLANQTDATMLLQKIHEILNVPDNELWVRLLEKILLAEDLNDKLQDIMTIFATLEKNQQFPWLEIIINDENCTLNDLISLTNNIDNLSIDWLYSYPLYKSQTLPDSATIISPKKTLIEQISGYFSKPTIIPEPAAPVVSAIHQQAWALWGRPIRPQVKKLNHWLSVEDTALSLDEELAKFDIWPHGPDAPSIESYESKKHVEFVQALEFHNDYPDKTELVNKLRRIFVAITANSLKSISELLSHYHQIKNANHADELLIAVIATLYFKALKKQVYPVQILCLLVRLHYEQQPVIFEVDTGEGKSIINALLAVLKYNRREKNAVIIKTANEELVFQDFFQKKHREFFQLLACPCKILQSIQDVESIKDGGIFYVSQLNFQILSATSIALQSCKFDMIVDEVDEILDITKPIAIVAPIEEMQPLTWIYDDINNFVDNNSHEHSPELTTLEWLRNAYEYIVRERKDDVAKLQQLRKIDFRAPYWRDLLCGSILSKKYLRRENQTFILQKNLTENNVVYKIVPYVNKKPLFEFHFGLNGLTQCLATRLERNTGNKFDIPPIAQKTDFINSFDHQQVQMFTGLSGSNGKVLELNELIKIFKAQSVRIGRNQPKKLETLPSTLMHSKHAHIQKIKNYVTTLEQPLLIFCEDITFARGLYEELKHLANKHCFLITGQEAKKEREDWLYNQNAQTHAGQTNCITIGTSILGRGIDITPQHPKGLLAIKTYLEENERVETQQNGRPARAGAPGAITSIIHINDSKIVAQSLPSHKYQRQKSKIQAGMTERKIEQLRLWCWQKLTERLPDEKYKAYLTPIFINEWQKFAPKWNIEDNLHIDFIINVLSELEIILSVHNVSDIKFRDAELRTQLELSNHWMQATNPVLKQHKNKKPLVQKTSVQNFIDNNLCTKIKDLSPPTVPSFWLRWINLSAFAIAERLRQDWEIFSENPNKENFQIFYENLLSSKNLYELQKEHSWFRLDYYFEELNILVDWGKFTKSIDTFIKIEPSPPRNGGQAPAANTNSSYFTAFMQIIFWPIKLLMFWFRPEAREIYTEYHSADNYTAKNETLQKILIFNSRIANLSFWRLDKYYWLNFFKEELAHLSSHLESSKSNNFTNWLSEREGFAAFRLKCLGHFLWQEQLIIQQQSYLSLPGQEDSILSRLEEQYNENNPEFTTYKIYEIGRFFKTELQQRYIANIPNQMQRDNCKITKHSMFYELAKEAIKQHIQSESPEEVKHNAGIRIKALKRELDNAENNREFLSIMLDCPAI